MHYTGQVYRPPMEAYTPLLEVTVGCSHNSCSFCTMYRKTKFAIAPNEQIIEDLEELAQCNPHCERVFILNGDPFVLPTEKLLHVARLIHSRLHDIKTITCYCSILDLKRKTQAELEELRAAGYNGLYIGLETGYDPALKQMNKGYTAQEEYEHLQRIVDAGFDYNALLMTGVAGKGNSEENVKATAALLNQIKPKIVAVLSTAVSPDSPLAAMRDAGEYIELTEREMAEEEIMLLEALEMDDDCFFFASHPFDLFPVSDYFAKKDQIIAYLREEMADTEPEFLDSVWQRGSI